MMLPDTWSPLAFGSGSYPTTRMCLEWVASYVSLMERADLAGLEFWRLPQPCWARGLSLWITMIGVPATRAPSSIRSVTGSQFFHDGLKRQQRWAGHFDVVVAGILARPLLTCTVFSGAGARANWCCLNFDRQAKKAVDSAIRRSTSRDDVGGRMGLSDRQAGLINRSECCATQDLAPRLATDFVSGGLRCRPHNIRCRSTIVMSPSTPLSDPSGKQRRWLLCVMGLWR